MTKYPNSECEAHRDVETSAPVCIICMGNEIETLTAQLDDLRDEMKAIALALGRSKTDGESDCDWHAMADEVEDIVNRNENLEIEHDHDESKDEGYVSCRK